MDNKTKGTTNTSTYEVKSKNTNQNPTTTTTTTDNPRVSNTTASTTIETPTTDLKDRTAETTQEPIVFKMKDLKNKEKLDEALKNQSPIRITNFDSTTEIKTKTIQRQGPGKLEHDAATDTYYLATRITTETQETSYQNITSLNPLKLFLNNSQNTDYFKLISES